MASNYAGTLIFCIIATTITIAILVMYFLINIEPVKYLLLTVEICLIIIIINAIITEVSNVKSAQKKAATSSVTPIQSIACPDYFTRKNVDGNQICENSYDTKNKMLSIGNGQTQINVSELQKKKGGDACKIIVNSSGFPWTTMDALCETISP